MILTARDPGRTTAYRESMTGLNKRCRTYIATIDLVKAHAIHDTGFRWNWLWGDSVWMFSLEGDYVWQLKRYQRHPPGSRAKSAYKNPEIVWTQQGAYLFSKLGMMQRFDPSFPAFCANIGFEPEYRMPVVPVEPQVGRIELLEWHHLRDNRLISAEVSGWHRNNRNLWIRSVPFNGTYFDRGKEERWGSSHDRNLSREGFMTFMSLFMQGQIDEARMALAL